YFASGDDGRKALNLAENPRVALTIDIYSDDWTLIKGVMVQGTARLYPRGPRFRAIRRLLYKKYPQYPREAAISESDSVVVEVTPRRVSTWGMKWPGVRAAGRRGGLGPRQPRRAHRSKTVSRRRRRGCGRRAWPGTGPGRPRGSPRRDRSRRPPARR